MGNLYYTLFDGNIAPAFLGKTEESIFDIGKSIGLTDVGVKYGNVCCN